MSDIKHSVVVRKHLWFTYRDVYINDNTRISYGFHLVECGNSYWLERKRNGKWKQVAWTYFGGTVESILQYLLWKEMDTRKAEKVFDNAE